MKKTASVILVISIVFSLLLVLQLNMGTSKAEEIEGFEVILTDDNLPKSHPAIHGTRVVWHENTLEAGKTNWEIFLYDLSIDTNDDGTPNYLENSTSRPVPDPAQIRITNNASEQFNPDIYGDIIVWEDKRSGNYDVYLYDLSLDTDFDGLPNYLDDDDDGDEILDTNDLDPDPAEKRLTFHPSHQEEPTVFGTKIAWVDMRYGNKDIFIYDILSGEEILLVGMNEGGGKDSPLQDNPKIYGDKVVWLDDKFTPGYWDICMYNLSVDSDSDGIPNYLDSDFDGDGEPDESDSDSDPAEMRLTATAESEYGPCIYGDLISFIRSESIYIYDIEKDVEYKLTDSTPSQDIDGHTTAIHGSKVVWAYDNGSKDVFLYDLALDSDTDGEPNYMDSDDPNRDLAICQITNQSETITMQPVIYGNKIVWHDSRNSTREIYLFVMSDNSPPEILDSSPGFYQEIWDNESITFNVSVEDPDGDLLSYSWYLNGLKVPGKTSDALEFVGDPEKTGQFQVMVVVSDGEYYTENQWLLTVKESNVHPPEITALNPAFNPSLSEGGTITLSITFSDPDVTLWEVNWSLDFPPTLLTEDASVSTSGGEAMGILTITSHLDHNGSNYDTTYNIYITANDGKFSTTHWWVLTVHYFEDADFDGYSDEMEMDSASDPLDPTSKPADLDGDGIPDLVDDDTDGDGLLDEHDDYPLDATKQVDEKSDMGVELIMILLAVVLLVVGLILVPKIAKKR